MAGITLVIELNENGNLKLTGGALKDQILAYGLLERAKDAIREHYSKQALQNAILPATLADLPRQ